MSAKTIRPYFIPLLALLWIGCDSGEDIPLSTAYLEGSWEFYSAEERFVEVFKSLDEKSGYQYWAKCPIGRDTCDTLVQNDLYHVREYGLIYKDGFGGSEYLAGVKRVSDKEMEINYENTRRKDYVKYKKTEIYQIINDEGRTQLILVKPRN